MSVPIPRHTDMIHASVSGTSMSQFSLTVAVGVARLARGADGAASLTGAGAPSPGMFTVM